MQKLLQHRTTYSARTAPIESIERIPYTVPYLCGLPLNATPVTLRVLKVRFQNSKLLEYCHLVVGECPEAIGGKGQHRRRPDVTEATSRRVGLERRRLAVHDRHAAAAANDAALAVALAIALAVALAVALVASDLAAALGSIIERHERALLRWVGIAEMRA